MMQKRSDCQRIAAEFSVHDFCEARKARLFARSSQTPFSWLVGGGARSIIVNTSDSNGKQCVRRQRSNQPTFVQKFFLIFPSQVCSFCIGKWKSVSGILSIHWNSGMGPMSLINGPFLSRLAEINLPISSQELVWKHPSFPPSLQLSVQPAR